MIRVLNLVSNLSKISGLMSIFVNYDRFLIELIFLREAYI